MKKLIIFTTDGGSREDGSVYYASYQLVDTTGDLKFSEDIFKSDFDHSGLKH